MKQVHEHSIEREAIVVKVAAAPHPPQEEYYEDEEEIEDAEYELLGEGEAPHEADDWPPNESDEDDLQIQVGGRPVEDPE